MTSYNIEEVDFFENLRAKIPKNPGINISKAKEYNIFLDLSISEKEELFKHGFTMYQRTPENSTEYSLFPVYLPQKNKSIESFLKGVSEANLIEQTQGIDFVVGFTNYLSNSEIFNENNLNRNDYFIICGLKSMRTYLQDNTDFSQKNIHLSLFKLHKFLITLDSQILHTKYFEKSSQLIFPSEYPKNHSQNIDKTLEERINYIHKFRLKS